MKRIKSILTYYFDILLFILLVCIKILLYGSQIETKYFSYTDILCPVLASILIASSFFALLKSTARIKGLAVLNLIISLILICDINYFRYYKDFPSVSVLRNILQLGAVRSSVASLFKIADLLFFIDLPIFIYLNIYYKSKAQREYNFKIRLNIFIAFLLSGIEINYFYIYRLNLDQPKLLTTMFNRVYVAEKLGALNAHSIDMYNMVKNVMSSREALDEEKELVIKSFLEIKNIEGSKILRGEAKGKNIIVIQVEALQQFVINRAVEGREITPNLNQWIKESAYFNNFFCQVSSGGTSDAEFMLNSSLYPAPFGSAYYLYSANTYSSIPKLIKDNGYSTAAFHGYKGTYWNRDVMYKAFGFDNFFSERDYKPVSVVGLGLSDKAFFNQSIEKLKNLQKPYYSFFITLSSHYPYEDKAGYVDFPSGRFKNTLLGDYLSAIHYADEALGEFLKALEAEGMLKDSLVIIYGDHNAIPENNKDALADFLDIKTMNELQWTQLQRVPLLIHFPQDKHKGTYETYGGQIDLSPTICNLLGIENHNALGRDLFNTTNNTIIFRNGSFLDESAYYSSSNNIYYDTVANKSVPETTDLKYKKEEALRQLDYSDKILQHNLLKKDAPSKNRLNIKVLPK